MQHPPKVLGKLPVLGRHTIWITVGQGPNALAVGTGGGCLDIFSETARYRLKYCLKGPLNPNQPTKSTEASANSERDLSETLSQKEKQGAAKADRKLKQNIRDLAKPQKNNSVR